MTTELRIYWECNGGRGHSSPSPNTPEELKSLEEWARRLSIANRNGLFLVREFKQGEVSRQVSPK